MFKTLYKNTHRIVLTAIVSLLLAGTAVAGSAGLFKNRPVPACEPAVQNVGTFVVTPRGATFVAADQASLPANR